MSTSVAPSGLRDLPRRLVVAFGFLTRIPMPAITHHDGDLRRALPVFPVVGLAVGGLGALVHTGAMSVLPAAPSAVLAVAATVMVTGAFHEDGLADVFDGFFGGFDPSRRLEIMRDSRIGTFGGAALVLSLLLRVTLLASLSPGHGAIALVTGHVLGRGAILLAVSVGRPAEPSSSSAAVAEPSGWAGTTIGGVLALGPVVGLLGIAAWVPVVAAAVAAVAMVGLATRKVGGLTGDVLGASNQVAHVAAMAAVVALAGAGHL